MAFHLGKKGSGMIENVLKSLARATPSLRVRYLERIRRVPGPQARLLEQQVAALVASDGGQRVA